MKIKTKLALTFTIIVASILLFFATAIYFFSSSYREAQFYARLEEKAINTAKLLVDVKEVSYDLLKIIEKNTFALVDEKVTIYNYSGKIIYYNNEQANTPLSNQLSNQIKQRKVVKKQVDKNDFLGFLFISKNNKFIVTASAYDKYGIGKLKNLRIILLVGLIISVGLTMLAGWTFADQALKPISNVISQVDKITARNLELRLDEGNRSDEIAHLSITFNQMLNRIEEAFNLQKHFVSNASHELRTPLTSTTGQLEVALLKERTSPEYITTMQSVLEDLRGLSRLTNGLLVLAQTNMDSGSLRLIEVRLDELLWNTRDELIKNKPNYKIDIETGVFPEDENKLTVLGSEQLLKSAITNLMDNACKFSYKNHANILFNVNINSISLSFMNQGIAIPKEDLKNIFQPFYRTENAKTFAAGHGLGLSLTEKIIKLHKGKIDITSTEQGKTTVYIEIPNTLAKT